MGAYVMEKQSYSFRSSLHGFHRGDVIDFLEKLSASHETELRERDEELRILREELADATSSLELAQTEIDLLRLGEETAPEPEPAPQQEACEPGDPNRELEAYRRAERYEREAKIRAEKICADASDAVKQAGAQLDVQRHGRLGSRLCRPAGGGVRDAGRNEQHARPAGPDGAGSGRGRLTETERCHVRER